MNNEETHFDEILSRLESEQWSQSIAKNVSTRYERIQTRNRFIISTVAIVFMGFVCFFPFFVCCLAAQRSKKRMDEIPK